MKLKFWGVRGSIPAPGPNTQHYGGNTTCLELRSDAGELIILDAGTGIFPLAQSLMAQQPIKANIFITHTHWDHIHGLPFFLPFFSPVNQVEIYGPFDVVSQESISRVMDVQMQYSYFPIREAELRAAIKYNNLQFGQSVVIGDATVSAILMNHPVVDYGYRIDCAGKSVFFTGDHEPWSNIYELGEEGYDEYGTLVRQQQKQFEDFIDGVGVLVVDCSYTREEYRSKQGWGHSTFDYAIDLALRVRAGTLICTHHEPTRSDQDLDKIFAGILHEREGALSGLELLLAREGMEVDVL